LKYILGDPKSEYLQSCANERLNQRTLRSSNLCSWLRLLLFLTISRRDYGLNIWYLASHLFPWFLRLQRYVLGGWQAMRSYTRLDVARNSACEGREQSIYQSSHSKYFPSYSSRTSCQALPLTTFFMNTHTNDCPPSQLLTLIQLRGYRSLLPDVFCAWWMTMEIYFFYLVWEGN